jgi:predicted O-linked N-acetylglucosamine transferase (SPINDLY family)
MDIALDTSPYPGGLTTCEALYMGVPVVTLKGNRHGARFCYSFLANLGLQELVAEDAEGYVDIAVKIAGDSELLSLLRANLRRMMQASPIMDAAAYMRDMESLYGELYQV